MKFFQINAFVLFDKICKIESCFKYNALVIVI